MTSTELSVGLTITRSTVPKPADREAWLAARAPYFNASSASILWDRHPYQSPGDYATTKLTGREQSENRAMIRGRRLEDVIAQWWADENRARVVEPEVLYVADDVMMATVDRIVVDVRGGSLIPVGTPVEIKTTSHRAREPEPYWLDQCQAIMLTIGAPQLVLVWFDADMDVQDRIIEADYDLWADMLERARRFMAAVEFGIVPDWITLSAANIADRYPSPAGAVELTDDQLGAVHVYLDARTGRLAAEKAEDAAKDAVARLFGERDTLTYAGDPVLTWKAASASTRFDVSRFREDHPELAALYEVEQPGPRRINVPKAAPA
jgi:predicted phage-related endonuclease